MSLKCLRRYQEYGIACLNSALLAFLFAAIMSNAFQVFKIMTLLLKIAISGHICYSNYHGKQAVVSTVTIIISVTCAV